MLNAYFKPDEANSQSIELKRNIDTFLQRVTESFTSIRYQNLRIIPDPSKPEEIFNDTMFEFLYQLFSGPQKFEYVYEVAIRDTEKYMNHYKQIKADYPYKNMSMMLATNKIIFKDDRFYTFGNVNRDSIELTGDYKRVYDIFSNLFNSGLSIFTISISLRDTGHQNLAIFHRINNDLWYYTFYEPHGIRKQNKYIKQALEHLTKYTSRRNKIHIVNTYNLKAAENIKGLQYSMRTLDIGNCQLFCMFIFYLYLRYIIEFESTIPTISFFIIPVLEHIYQSTPPEYLLKNINNLGIRVYNYMMENGLVDFNAIISKHKSSSEVKESEVKESERINARKKLLKQVYGYGTSPGKYCDSDDECESKRCVNSRCAKKRTECKNDSDCEETEFCKNGECAEKGWLDDPCSNNRECLDELRCLNSKCSLRSEKDEFLKLRN
jgi:hypothetical protein